MNRSLGGKYTRTAKRGNNFRHSVVIGVLKTIPFQVVDMEFQLVAPANISVPCAYQPCGRLPNLHDQLSEAIIKLPEPRILVGDLNGHHPSWGCPRSDPRGVTLVDIFEKEDIVILNDGVPTYFNEWHTSAIDVSDVSRCFAGKTQWQHGDPDGAMNKRTGIAMVKPFSPRYYSVIRTALKTLQKWYTKRQQQPSQRPAAGRKVLRLLDKGTRKALKARRKALRRIKRLPIEHPDRKDALRNYHESHNQCRQEIRVAKRASWMDFLEGRNSSQSSADLWRQVNALSGKRRMKPLHVQINGEAVSDPAIVADELGSYFADLAAIEKYEDEFKWKAKLSTSSIASFSVSSDAGNSEINQAFSWQELQHTLRCSNGKSAGPDEIGYPLLKRLPTRGQLRMLELFNKLWLTNSYSASWKESLVIPIPKANETIHEVSKFRPIALTCCFAKVLERMVNRRLKHFLEAENLLDHQQHIFRQGYGTPTYFATLGEVLKSAKDSGLHTEIVSLDIL
ncbi:uncharacterized protein LOC135707292 [Ochlerotatus camptorhynchus]|uniref:uncharacterized protein LOC135707292 n=1 Tax=Ochlerotatus camptorhynchus TaxID=644619 RepID=UPI0031E30A0E